MPAMQNLASRLVRAMPIKLDGVAKVGISAMSATPLEKDVRGRQGSVYTKKENFLLDRNVLSIQILIGVGLMASSMGGLSLS